MELRVVRLVPCFMALDSTTCDVYSLPDVLNFIHPLNVYEEPTMCQARCQSLGLCNLLDTIRADRTHESFKGLWKYLGAENK